MAKAEATSTGDPQPVEPDRMLFHASRARRPERRRFAVSIPGARAGRRISRTGCRRGRSRPSLHGHRRAGSAVEPAAGAGLPDLGHANCPRFVRGLSLIEAPPTPARREPMSPAVIGAALVLAASLAASFGFLAVRGGITVPLGSGSPPPVAVVTGPSAAPIASPAVAPTPPASSFADPSPRRRSPSPPPTATPAPTPSPTPRPTPTPAPSSDRYALLTAVPVAVGLLDLRDPIRRQPPSIANWFGVSYNRMIAMNPNLRTPIHAGDRLRIPTPTR